MYDLNGNMGHVEDWEKKESKRLITISYVAGEGMVCDVENCEAEADYMADGDVYCTFHWTKSAESTSLDELDE